ncbi:MAG: hypothetical protein CMA31_02850 [Euryarchaeota archaeon]|nr:hypothetical protein [Euryarchaeota archaeon]
MRSKDEYQDLADCIRSDQLSNRQIVEEFEADPEFAKWYKEKYLGTWPEKNVTNFMTGNS